MTAKLEYEAHLLSSLLATVERMTMKQLVENYKMQNDGSGPSKFETRETGAHRLKALLTAKLKEVEAKLAEAHAKGPELAASGKAKAPAAKAKAPKAETERKPSISGKCQELILAGKTDEQIFAELTSLGLVTDAKKQKSYPAWNRAAMKRKGLLSA
jgi:hypothetical protein